MKILLKISEIFINNKTNSKQLIQELIKLTIDNIQIEYLSKNNKFAD